MHESSIKRKILNIFSSSSAETLGLDHVQFLHHEKQEAGVEDPERELEKKQM